MRADGYIRVSRVGGREGDSFISPDVQRTQITRWAQLRNVEIVAWHTDLDQTGGKMDRPGLDAAIHRIENGETGGLVVARWDRFARTLSGALDAIKRIDDAGGALASVAEGIDPTTPAGKFQRDLFLLLAEYQRSQTRDNWAVAQERAIARGVHIASKTPTGYVRGSDGKLEPHPTFGPAIGEAFRMRAEAESWRTIAAYLDNQGVVGPYGANNWRTRAVTHIIQNRVYLGEARSGKNVNRHAHQPLTDPVTWERAQRARAAPVATKHEPALLAGLLRCAGCRHVLKPDRMTTRGGNKVRLYRCRGEHSTGTCADRAAVLGSVIEPWVETQFFSRIGELPMAGDVLSQTVEDHEVAVREAEAEMVAFRDNESLAQLGDVYVDGLKTRAERVDEARRELADARGEVIPTALALDVELEAAWPALEVTDRQKLLGVGIDTVMLRSGRSLPISERALVLWRGDAPDDLPRRGLRVSLRPFDWPPGGARVAST